MKPYLKKGASVICPKCLKSILIIIEDVFLGDRIIAEHFDIQEKYKDIYSPPKNGDMIKCLACKEEFNDIECFNLMEGILRKW